MVNKRAVRRGFTLTELLVSIVILTLGLIALSQLYMAAMWTYQKARYMSVATQRAQLELEKVHNLGFLPMNEGPLIGEDCYRSEDGYTALTDARGVNFPVTELPQGQGTVTVEHFQDEPGLLSITINVTWGGATRARSDVKVMTLLANK